MMEKRLYKKLKSFQLKPFLNEEDLKKLALVSEICNYKKGEVIFKEGQRGDAIYILLNGRVRIYKTTDNRELTLAVLTKGSLFGEMDVINPTKKGRTAGAKAETSCRLIRIPAQEIRKGIKTGDITIYRFIHLLSVILCSRLRTMDDAYSRLFIECKSEEARDELRAFREKLLKEWKF